MERTCDECKYMDVSVKEEPCKSCDGPNCRFKPKEENMGEKTYTMTFTTDKISEEDLHDITGNTTPDYKAKLDEANEYIDELNYKLQTARTELATMRGMIDGLKFAVRCNGVSGGEVR